VRSAYSQYYSTSLIIKPLVKMQIEFSGSRYYLYKTPWKDEIYDVSTIRNEILYQFTHHLSFRIITDYYTQTKKLSFYPLLSYELNPFTLFYLGANINTIKYPEKIETQDHQIFLKFQYWFKL